jgi:tetratricopeptide (TPR) repeat protein
MKSNKKVPDTNVKNPDEIPRTHGIPAGVRTGSGSGPAVSVIMQSITKNTVPMLRSVLAQTLADIEVIVANGSSITIDDPRVQILKNADRKGDIFHIASSHARGRYITVASPGVVWAPYYLEAMVHALDSRPEADAAYGSSAIIDRKGNVVEVRNREFTDVLGASLEDAAIVVRAHRIPETSGPGVVSDLLLRCVEHSEIVYVPEILYYAYRMSAHGTMARAHQETLKEITGHAHTVCSFTGSSAAPDRSADFSVEVRRHLRDADEQFSTGNLAGARDALNEALWIAPDEPELLVAYGNILLRLGDLNGARNEFLKVTRIAPAYGPGFTNLAPVYLHEGKLDKAAETIDSALRLSPDDIAAIKLRGIIRLRQKRSDEAAQDFNSVLKTSPADTEALMGIASVYLQQGDEAGVRRTLTRVLSIDPGHREAADGLRRLDQQKSGITYDECTALLQQGRMAEALTKLEAFSAEHQDHIDALLDLSALYFEKGDIGHAEAAVRKVMALDDRHVIGRKNLADILMAQQRFDESVREHMRVLDDNPDDPESLYTIGLINLKLGKPEDAAFFFQRVVAVDASRNDVRALLHAIAPIVQASVVPR